ncbi:cellulose-binding protein [Streptomyces niveiscabiei]|uniref:cellulose-binding protein n=1 Tax=Streptomyces niveiscabiei TaxID=164115 RepID=UPI0029B02CE5|nr:cellulose-binding protein [Streptomyces niveiscabiei]MDX3387745.1 cellulose-binding protein [Streptomyces niveiscabiei]
MGSASVSPYGFGTVRGRGYRPSQVEAYVAALCADRDAAWDRAARLTVQVKEAESEATRLREAVLRLTPQSYETLGETAHHLFRLARHEAHTLRERARHEARDQAARADEQAAAIREEAESEARRTLAEAEEWGRQRIARARAEADEIRVTARREVKRDRAKALEGLREVRRRTESLRTRQDQTRDQRREAIEREALARARTLDAHYATLIARAESALCEARATHTEAEKSATRLQSRAHTHATALLTEAHHQADRIARETERVLREHGERWDDVRAHMDYVRTSLSALTGRAVE